ncbi:hypothetical protein BDN70DRAFT_525861 [Pholiota conissans]|uniref:Uncharacterized protein n=1 Tax=Pholiota conissans TaxID=109636 RepID=A0A9P5YNK7_9AGAR|nr:hypothetical protein BDN70DRAFT_525861 [Pholiota conissans]
MRGEREGGTDGVRGKSNETRYSEHLWFISIDCPARPLHLRLRTTLHAMWVSLRLCIYISSYMRSLVMLMLLQDTYMLLHLDYRPSIDASKTETKTLECY